MAPIQLTYGLVEVKETHQAAPEVLIGKDRTLKGGQRAEQQAETEFGQMQHQMSAPTLIFPRRRTNGVAQCRLAEAVAAETITGATQEIIVQVARLLTCETSIRETRAQLEWTCE